MIYDNCIKYIDKELKRNLIDKEWKQKYFLIYGLDSLGKTVYMLLKEYKVSKLEYYDSSIYNKEWAQNECVKNVNNAIEETLRDNGFIIVCNKTDKIKITELIKEINPTYNKNIVDLSGIRMNKMPNPILPTQYEKYADLKECHNVLMDILNAFCDFCDKHNLRYFLDYGTLLGAVRHKGFIPWDDDIDVFMMRDDYNKMLKIAPNYFKEPYFFQSAYTDVMVWGFSKLRDSRTTAIEFDDMKEQFNQGIFIDIFPLDSTDDGSAKMKTVTNIKKDIWDCIFNREAILNNIDNPDIWKIFTLDKDMILELVNMSYKDALRVFEEFCETHLYDTDKLRCWSSEVMGRLRKHYERKWFDKIEYAQFENILVPVPADYEEVLTMEYIEWKIPVKSETLHSGIIIDPDISYKEWLKSHTKYKKNVME